MDARGFVDTVHHTVVLLVELCGSPEDFIHDEITVLMLWSLPLQEHHGVCPILYFNDARFGWN